MIARILAAVMAAVLMAWGAPLIRGLEKCPGINSANHKTNLYDLTYESWVKKADKGDLFIFGRCIQTNNNAIVRVDWKKANVKGYLEPGKPCRNEIPSLTKDEIVVMGDLHYGAKQEKIVAAFKDVKVQDQTKLEALRSFVKISIPRRAGDEEIKDPSKLRRVDAKFTSSVKEGRPYEYKYSWEANREKDLLVEQVIINWKVDEINQAIKASNAKGGSGAMGQPKLSAEPQSVSLTSDSPPVYSIAVVEFLSEDGKTPVGSASVAIYRPMSALKKPKKEK